MRALRVYGYSKWETGNKNSASTAKYIYHGEKQTRKHPCKIELVD